jgi:signal peptidase I
VTGRPADAGRGPLAPGPPDRPEVVTDPSVGAEVRSTTEDAGRSRLLHAVREVVVTLVLAAVLYIVIQTFVAQTYRVEQQSMEPTLQPGQHVLIDKLTPRFDDFSRGDVVVFRPHDAEPDATPFIKRVIGTSGDRVEIREGRVYVNGAVLDEPYLAQDEPTEADGEASSWVVEDGTLFVLGDHRTASRDSRAGSIGLVPSSDVIGRAWLSFWPLDTLGILETPRYTGIPDPEEG